jgi:DNA-binding NtrC family response regulator
MKILIADDEEKWRTLLSELCKKLGHKVHVVSDGADVTRMSDDTLRTFHLALLDYRMPRMNGLDAGLHLLKVVPGITVAMLTGDDEGLGWQPAIAATRGGFNHYWSKLDNYEDKLTQTLELASARLEFCQKSADEPVTLAQIVGKSAVMQELRKLIQKVAPTDARVLILGKTGTGKELVAGALHHLSRRHEANYTRINCAAIPETLLESELFGHEKGAFTGALKQKPGRFEEANGGTIFLDEIADMSKPLQAKLLRFLEDGSFTRVGGIQELRVNVRLIAATNKDIKEAIAADKFREDLFHRLNVVTMFPPLLCERENDVLLLADHFLTMFRVTMNRKVEGFASASRQKLQQYHWPGNVRELRNAVERALILETSNMIMPDSLPDWEPIERPPSFQLKGLPHVMQTVDAEAIKSALLHNDSDVAKAASVLGISKNLLQERIQQLGIQNADEPKSTTVAGEAGSGPVVGGQPSGRRFWELLKERGFKLWEIVNPESVRAQAAEALKNATLNNVSSPTTAGQNAGTSSPTRRAKTSWRLDRFVPPPPFKVSYVNPTTRKTEEIEIALKADYHPEPNYIKHLYAPKHGTYQIPSIRAAIYRYAVEKRITSFRKAFEKMTETVIDVNLAGLVKGSGKDKLKTGAVNLWETEKTSAFLSCHSRLKHSPTEVDQEIKEHFPDYKRPTV